MKKILNYLKRMKCIFIILSVFCLFACVMCVCVGIQNSSETVQSYIYSEQAGGYVPNGVYTADVNGEKQENAYTAAVLCAVAAVAFGVGAVCFGIPEWKLRKAPVREFNGMILHKEKKLVRTYVVVEDESGMMRRYALADDVFLNVGDDGLVSCKSDIITGFEKSVSGGSENILL